MDAVVSFGGGAGIELRFTLRSLDRFVEHDRVWLAGAAPDWATGVLRLPGSSTTEHLRQACQHPDVSDPFMWWHDDMFVTQPARVVLWHNGVMQPRPAQTLWASGQRATYRWLQRNGFPRPLSFDVHLPLLVFKTTMLDALAHARTIPHRAPHKRTIYGNLTGLEGVYTTDCKMTHPRAVVEGPWLSSADATFTTSVLPRLTMLDTPSRYELTQ